MDYTANHRAAAIRTQRATEQANNYGLLRQPNGVFSVVKTTDATVYETTPTSCTCPDFAYRGSKTTPPTPCKHQFLVREEQARLDQQQQARLTVIENARRNMARDFPISD